MNIQDEKSLIQEEEVKYRSAVSESTFFKIGASLNFMLNRLHLEKKWALNGFYPSTYNGVDGLTVFHYAVEIFGCAIYNIDAGSAGVTILDIKRVSTGVSIFAQYPAIYASAGNNAYISMGESKAGCQAPIFLNFLPVQIAAGEALRCDLISGQINGKNCGIILFYRPV